MRSLPSQETCVVEIHELAIGWCAHSRLCFALHYLVPSSLSCSTCADNFQLGNCCGSAILAAARSCNINDPPCVVSAEPAEPVAAPIAPDVPPAAPGAAQPTVVTAAKRYVAVGLYAGAASGIQEAANREAQYGFRFQHLLRFVCAYRFKQIGAYA
jgi:hypothetical protein